MKNLSFILLCLFLTTGCGESKKKLEGERFSIFTPQYSTTKSQQEIILDHPIINELWNQTGGNKEHNISHLAGRKNATLLYKKSIGHVGKTSQILYSPVANANTIYTIDGNLKLISTDIKTSNTNFVFQEVKKQDGISFGALALDNEDLWLITNNSSLIKLDSKTGNAISTSHFNTPLKSGLSLCGKILLFVNDLNNLTAINSETNEKLWSYKAFEEASTFIKGSTPACNEDTVVIGFSNGEAHAIDLNTGKPKWQNIVSQIKNTSLNNIPDIVANPIINNNMAILKSYNDMTRAFDITTGMELWKSKTGGLTNPIVTTEYIFTIDNNKTLNAMDILTGNIIYESKLKSNKKDAIANDPLLINNQIVATFTDGTMIKINPYTGEIISTETVASKIDTSPIVIDDKLILIGNGNLMIFK